MTSSLVVRGECKICFEDKLELDSFQVFPCGHCLCQNCIHDLFTTNGRRVKCPFCRKSWLRTDASKLVFYPIIVDLTDSSADYVVDGLNRMDKTCKTISVKRAHAKLTKAAENIEQDSAERLRKAIEDFSQRIIPLFEELELGRKRIQELEENQHTKFQDLAVRSRRVDVLEREVSHLRRSKAELESNLSESLDSAEAFRVKVEELQGSLTDVRRNMSVKEEELNRAIDSLNRFKSSDTLKSKKLKILKQDVEILSAKLQEKDSSTEERNNMMDQDQDHLLDAALAAQSSALSSLHRHSSEAGWTTVDNDFQFEGMPAPGFRSNWNNGNNAGKKPNILLKKSPGCTKVSSSFPLNLDGKGRPTTAVQMGPKSTIRVTRRF